MDITNTSENGYQGDKTKLSEEDDLMAQVFPGDAFDGNSPTPLHNHEQADSGNDDDDNPEPFDDPDSFVPNDNESYMASDNESFVASDNESFGASDNGFSNDFIQFQNSKHDNDQQSELETENMDDNVQGSESELERLQEELDLAMEIEAARSFAVKKNLLEKKILNARRAKERAATGSLIDLGSTPIVGRG